MIDNSEFMEFMKGNAVSFEETVDYKIDRFSKPFQLRALDGAQERECKEAATTRTVVNGRTKRDFDPDRYQDLLTARTVVYPNLNSAALQDSYGVKSPADLLKTMLKAGEYIDLQMEVNKINGFVKPDELIEEAKN